MPKPTGTWTIRKIPRGGGNADDWLWPYLVIGPDGQLRRSAATGWGARRLLGRYRRREAGRTPVKWWDAPVVHEESADA